MFGLWFSDERLPHVYLLMAIPRKKHKRKSPEYIHRELHHGGRVVDHHSSQGLVSLHSSHSSELLQVTCRKREPPLFSEQSEDFLCPQNTQSAETASVASPLKFRGKICQTFLEQLSLAGVQKMQVSSWALLWHFSRGRRLHCEPSIHLPLLPCKSGLRNQRAKRT